MPLPDKWTTEDIIALTYLKGLNYPLIIKIVNSYSSIEALLTSDLPHSLSGKLMQTGMFDDPVSRARENAARQIELCRNLDVNPLTLWDSQYPSLLKQTDYPPVLIYTKGSLQAADAAAVSIVGTRKCTTYGKLTTERFAGCFARHGLVVVSGLAYGIDTEAHQATVRASGITYAVIACGIDCISPPISAKIAESIINSGGALISEYKCGTKALPPYFPQRNRIISGISKATVVIESGKKGGALITAQFAFDQQREVYAVPGNITSDRSLGTNFLIKKNLATLAVSPEIILEDMGIIQNAETKAEAQTVMLFGQEEESIYNCLGFEPVHIDEIALKTGLDIPQLLVKLLNLEFRNVVRQLPAKYYIRN